MIDCSVTYGCLYYLYGIVMWFVYQVKCILVQTSRHLPEQWRPYLFGLLGIRARGKPNMRTQSMNQWFSVFSKIKLPGTQSANKSMTINTAKRPKKIVKDTPRIATVPSCIDESSPSSRFAFLMGGDVTLNLGGAVNEDIRRLCDVCLHEYRIPSDNITIITQIDKEMLDYAKENNLALSSMSKDRLIDELTLLAERIEQCEDRSFLLLHYSGHGVQERDTNGDEADGYDEAICVEEDQTMNDDVFSSLLLERLPKSNTTLFLMDQCHSGSFGDLTYCFDERRNVYYTNAKKPKQHSAKIYAISGCKDDEVNYQAFYKDGRDGGILTSLFVEGSNARGVLYKSMIDNPENMIKHMNKNIFTPQTMLLTCSRK